MITYYYEFVYDVGGCGHFQQKSDEDALEFVKDWINKGWLMCLYKESETDNGLPFIMLWEK